MESHLMPTTMALVLGLFVGTAFADTVADAPITHCPMDGPANGLSEDCALLRATFRADMTTCMKDLKIKALARTNEVYLDNAHASRARMLICDRQVRDRMGLTN